MFNNTTNTKIFDIDYMAQCLKPKPILTFHDYYRVTPNQRLVYDRMMTKYSCVAVETFNLINTTHTTQTKN